MAEKINFDKDCACIVSRVVDTVTDSQGRTVRRYQDFLTTDNIELGSMSNPKNTDIIAIEWRDTKQRKGKKSAWFNSP